MKILLRLFVAVLFFLSCKNEKSLTDTQAKNIIENYLSETELGQQSKIDSVLILTITPKSDFDVLQLQLSKLKKDLEWQSKFYSDTKRILTSAGKQIENIDEGDSTSLSSEERNFLMWKGMTKKTNDNIDSIIKRLGTSDKEQQKNNAIESVVVSRTNEGIVRHQILYVINDSLKVTDVYLAQ